MSNRKQSTRRVLVAPLVVLAPALSLAQVDTSDWACESCPFDQGYRAKISAGATSVSDDAARFGNYTGYDEEGTYGNLDGEGRYSSDGYRLDYTLEDLGLDSRAFDLSVSNSGRYGFDIGYRELPFRRFDTSRTIFSRSGSDMLVLPAGWVPAGTTGAMTQLDSSLSQVVVGTDRQITDIGGYWNARDAFRVFADFRRQSRDGIDITSAGSYTQASFLPRWIDFETDQVDAGIEYRRENLSLALAWYGSFFTNKNPSLTWETPFLATPETSVLRMAREPDNEFQQVSLSGKYRLDAWNTVIAFLAATGTGKQDEQLLDYTINGDYEGLLDLPRNTLDGKVDTLNYSFTLTSRPNDRLRVKFGYRYDERDNRTPIAEWSRVIVDAFPSGDAGENVPYSYDRMHTTTSVEYRVLDNLRFSGGYEYREINRDFQEVAEQTTNTGWGQVRVQPFAWLDLRARGGRSVRGVDRYDESVAVSLGQNPLMRKYYLAYRDREYGEVIASFTPLEAPVSFSASVLFADDDYKDSLLGLNGSEEFRATADFSWAVSESATFYVAWGRDSIDAHQTGSEQADFWDWSAFHQDRFDHTGFGVSVRPADSKFSLSVDYSRADGETRIELISLSGGPSQLPNLESRLDSGRIEASYAFNDRLEATFSLRYERFELEDWALVSPTALPTILTLGAEPYDYDVYAAGFGIRYRFGTDKIELVD
jgi:MtrB/PioB family decaheme-associated outer membrane protein